MTPFNLNFQSIADLPARAQAPSELKGTWGIARVRHNQTAPLIGKLDALGYDWCVPLVMKRSKRWGDHMIPLFPNYAPVCCAQPEDLFEVGQLDCVCDVLRIVDQKRFIRELSAVHTATRDMLIDVYPFATVGRYCRVRRGPFMGFNGRIESRDGREFVVLQMQIMGALRPTQISLDDLEPDDTFVMN